MLLAKREMKIIKRAPFVDAVFGPQTLHRLPELINLKEATGKPQIDISFPEIEKFDNLPISASKKPSAMVSIMEGCGKYCSFLLFHTQEVRKSQGH